MICILKKSINFQIQIIIILHINIIIIYMYSHVKNQIALMFDDISADNTLQFVVMECDVSLQLWLALLHLAAKITPEKVLAGISGAECLPGFVYGDVPRQIHG